MSPGVITPEGEHTRGTLNSPREVGGGKVPILDCLETRAWSQLSFVLFFLPAV